MFHKMFLCTFVSLLFSVFASCAADAPAPAPLIDPAKAAQLKRLEPLTPEKIDVFVDAGQLSPEQAAFVKTHIGADGRLALPETAIAGEPLPRPAGPPENIARPVDPSPPAAVRSATPQPVPARPISPSTATAQTNLRAYDPYADFHYSISEPDRERLRLLIAEFRQGNRTIIGKELRQSRPAVNQLIAPAYMDPIDLPIKIRLWKDVCGPVNADAAIGMFDTYRALVALARPVLIPYEKDAGGVIVRRSIGSDAPAAGQQYFGSHEMRNMIEELEDTIAKCQGFNAAVFLMNVYSQRYDIGEAPMRDTDRDRHLMVEACGGNPKKFEDDKSSTWHSILSMHDRALIADALIPWLNRPNSDRRKIAMNGLMICLPHDHPNWHASASDWERWWSTRKGELMAER